MITSSFAMAQVRAEGSKAHNPRKAQNDFGINYHEGNSYLLKMLRTTNQA